MRLRFALALILAMGLSAATATAQDPGVVDTMSLIPTVAPIPGTAQSPLRLELYIYNDEGIAGLSSGFRWDNPKIQMDSAVATAEMVAAFDLGRFFFQDNILATTNANRQFLFGAAALFSTGMAPVTNRRLAVTYYFTANNWTASDHVVFDTLQFNAGSEWLFSGVNGESFRPEWTGGFSVPPQAANNAPVLAAIGAKSVNEGVNLNFNVSATDTDGDPLTLTASPLPTGATFTDHGDGTGTFNWTPTFAQANVYNVTFAVSDGTDSDNELVAITVNNVNQLPVLAAIGPKSVNEGVNLNFVATASDADGTTPTLSASPLPEGATFIDNGNGTGTFNWTPTFAQSGPYNVTFTASDGIGNDQEIVAITVNNVNQAPVLAEIGPKATTVAVQLLFDATATDPDGTTPTLSATNLPTGATFTDHGDGSGTFDWTPTAGQTGGHDVTFTASDGSLTDQEIVTITVNSAANQAPVLAAIGPQSVDEGVNLNFGVSATDPDATTPALSASPLPAGATFIDNGNGTGTFNWTPTFAQSGPYNVTFTASDGSLTDEEVVTITVNNVNQAPVLAEIGPKSTSVEVQLLFNVTATDPDGTTPALSATNLPVGASFVDNGDGSGTFDWTPTVDQAGPFNVTFTASDGSLTDEEIVAITVNSAANQAPVLAAIGPQSVDEGQSLNIPVTGTDPDGTSPALTAENLPAGASFVDNGGGSADFDWSPDFTQSGVYEVRFIASDGSLADSELVTITVNNVNLAPLFVTIPADTTIDECDTLEALFEAADPDGQEVTYGAIDLMPGMTFHQVDQYGMFMFDPDTTQAGTYPIVVFATDGEDTSWAGFTITVEDCAPPAGCVRLVLSDTAFYFFDTVEYVEGPIGFDILAITTDSGSACYTVFDTTSWLLAAPDEGCTPGNVTVSYNATGLDEGVYHGFFTVTGDGTVCEPVSRFIPVVLNLVDTAQAPVETADSIIVATVPAVPGADVVVPVLFKNQCDLLGLIAYLESYSADITIDSVSFADSRLIDYPNLVSAIVGSQVQLEANYLAFGDSTPPVGPGFGNLANLFCSVAGDASIGFHEIAPLSGVGEVNTAFTLRCNAGEPDIMFPVLISGGIMVETASQFTCGYVVDPEGAPIEGATVELWPDFPSNGPAASTITDTSGYFEFNDFIVGNFDLYAYHSDYYPGVQENIAWGTTGIMIVLSPWTTVVGTPEWVSFFCDANLYFDAPLPVGSIIDAYDPDGIRCGTWRVTEAGKYGFMPVYRDDSYSEGEDEGADPGDIIRFFINGIEAQATGNTEWTQAFDVWEVCLDAGEFTKTCDLVTGWNLVSWSVDTESDDIEDALASIADHVIVVLGFEQGGLTYDPNLPQFSTLWNVDHLSGYWIKVDADVTLELTGAPVSAATPIPVTLGWNLVSYLPDFPLATADALSSLGNDVRIALGFDGGGLVYVPGDDVHNTLIEMGPCFGYWIKALADGELIYPADAPVIFAQQREPLGNPVAKAASDITATTEWMNLYARNLKLDGHPVPAGTVVEAFTLDGLKIGSSAVREDGLFGFMPVYADDHSTGATEGVLQGQTFQLKVNGVAVEETFVYTGHGSQLEISNLTAKAGEETNLPTDFSLSQNYPNPFNPSTTIEFSLPKAAKTRIEIYNVLGELVATPFDGVAQSGSNVVTWDGTAANGSKVASGIYFYRLSADNYSETKKMTLMK